VVFFAAVAVVVFLAGVAFFAVVLLSDDVDAADFAGAAFLAGVFFAAVFFAAPADAAFLAGVRRSAVVAELDVAAAAGVDEGDGSSSATSSAPARLLTTGSDADGTRVTSGSTGLGSAPVWGWGVASQERRRRAVA
jgi:hypothetical protein